MSACPCGSGDDEAACCAPIIAGAAATSAEALMRSRYTAYVRGAIDHIVATHDASTRATIDVAAATTWSKDTAWLGLEILAATYGGATDDTGEVEFVVRGVLRGAPFTQRERSRFRKVDGRWYYVDGVARAMPERAAVVPGRNEPCPCGSGKKYKVCHGR